MSEQIPKNLDIKSDKSNDISIKNAHEIKELRNDFDKLKDDSIANYISVLGIFASVVSLILVEVQILKNTCSFNQLIGLSLIIFSMLSSFILMLINFFGNGKNADSKTLIVFIALTFIVGLFFSFKSQYDNCLSSTLPIQLELSAENIKKNSQNIDNIEKRVLKLELINENK